MAPRRGSGYSSSSYSSAWTSTTLLSLEYGYYGYGSNRNHYKDLYYAMFAFDILTLIAFIVFLVWACTIRNRGLPLKGIISALICFTLSQICVVVIEALYVATTEVMMYFLITYMLSQFFSFLGNCLLFYIFWGLIHRLLGRLTDSGKPYAAVTIVHWVLFSLTLLFSLAAWAVYVVYTVGSVTYSTFITAMDWINIGSAIHILYWILSLEILAWSIFVFVKAGSHRFVSKMPVLALISATVGWFALNLAWMVVWIRYNLERRNTVPEWHNTAQAVVNFIFWVVTFVGILLCCSKWRRLGEDPEKSDAPIRYPYPQYASGQYPPAHHPPAGQYPPNGNYPSPGQYPPGQYQTPYPNQPNGTAPYHDYAANPATSPPPAQRAASPQ